VFSYCLASYYTIAHRAIFNGAKKIKKSIASDLTNAVNDACQ